jgi:hypothetical protein
MKHVRKRCDKCGVVTLHAIRERRCKRSERNAMGLTGFACWGKLRLVVEKKTTKRKREPMPSLHDGVGLGHVLTQEYEAAVLVARCDRVRDKAREQVEKITSKLKEKREKIRSIKRQIVVWERKQKRHIKTVNMTNDEIEAIRQRAIIAGQVRAVRHRLRKSAKETS